MPLSWPPQMPNLATCGEGYPRRQIDIRSREMDLHINVADCAGRIDVDDRLVLRTVRGPADAVCAYRCSATDLLNDVSSCYGRKVEMVYAGREIGDRVLSDRRPAANP